MTFINAVKIVGRRVEQNNEVTEYEPNSKLRFKSTSGGPISSEAEFTFQSVTGGTKVTFVGEGEGSGFFKITEPLIACVMKRQWETNVANLKDLPEAQA